MKTETAEFIVDHAITEDRPPTRELKYVPEPSIDTRASVDHVQLALGAAVIALANVDRIIRQHPPVTSTAELHPHDIGKFLRAARETAMAQHPGTVLKAVAVASEELREIIDRLVTDPEAAIISDPERMKDACAAMARLVISKYNGALYAALDQVRAEQEAK